SRRPNALASQKPTIAPAVRPNHEAKVPSTMPSRAPAKVLTRLEGTGSRMSEVSTATVARNVSPSEGGGSNQPAIASSAAGPKLTNGRIGTNNIRQTSKSGRTIARRDRSFWLEVGEI